MPKKNTSKSTPPLAASWPEKPPPDYSSGGRVDPTLTDGRWFYYPPRSWVRLDTLSVLELARRDVGAGATRTPEEIEAARVALSMSNALRQFAEEIAQDATPPARRADLVARTRRVWEAVYRKNRDLILGTALLHRIDGAVSGARSAGVSLDHASIARLAFADFTLHFPGSAAALKVEDLVPTVAVWCNAGGRGKAKWKIAAKLVYTLTQRPIAASSLAKAFARSRRELAAERRNPG